MTTTYHIRPETEADKHRVYQINLAAFEQPAEADLVDRLRQQVTPHISLVATAETAEIIGHIMFTPVTIDQHPTAKVMGLAPVSVHPDQQKSGAGQALITAGLEQCSQMGYGAVILLGHPSYYPRFGFTPASRFGLATTYNVPDEVFMALELKPGYLAPFSGVTHYHPAFEGV